MGTSRTMARGEIRACELSFNLLIIDRPWGRDKTDLRLFLGMRSFLLPPSCRWFLFDTLERPNSVVISSRLGRDQISAMQA
jgi:hypothetical protein